MFNRTYFCIAGLLLFAACYYSLGVGLVAQIATTENDLEDIKEEMYLMNYRVQ